MTAQDWIVWIIVALAAAAAVRRLACRLRGADKCASCDAEQCPLHRLRRKK